jgi:hypothetical protein
VLRVTVSAWKTTEPRQPPPGYGPGSSVPGSWPRCTAEPPVLQGRISPASHPRTLPAPSAPKTAWVSGRLTPQFQELVEDDTIDVIHICTPNATTTSWPRIALKAGKHVVCEKPLATNVQDATELVELAAAAGTVATVPFVYRFHPMIREARERMPLVKQDGFPPSRAPTFRIGFCPGTTITGGWMPCRWSLTGVRRHRLAPVRPSSSS